MVNPLARVVMANVSKKTGHSKEFKSLSSEDRVSNITRKDEDMIRNIINRNSKVETNTNNKSMVTLDEVANGIKGKA